MAEEPTQKLKSNRHQGLGKKESLQSAQEAAAKKQKERQKQKLRNAGKETTQQNEGSPKASPKGKRKKTQKRIEERKQWLKQKAEEHKAKIAKGAGPKKTTKKDVSKEKAAGKAKGPSAKTSEAKPSKKEKASRLERLAKKGRSATAERNARKRAAKKRKTSGEADQGVDKDETDPSAAFLDNPMRAPTPQAAKKFFRPLLKGKSFNVNLGPVEGWRTEAKLAVRCGPSGPMIGLFAPGTHEVCDLGDCKAHHPAINQAVQLVRESCVPAGVLGFNEQYCTGDLRYVKLEAQRATEKVQLTLVWHAASVEEAGKPLRRLVKSLQEHELFYAIWVNFNNAGKHVSRIFAYERQAWEQLAGEEKVLRERLSDCPLPYKAPKLCFPPFVFRQANLCAFGKIVSTLRRFVPAGSRVVELYGGVGTIGLHLADLVKSLECSDENPENAACFDKSVKSLPEELRDRFCYKQGDAASQLPRLLHCDLVIVDPPRKGLDEKVLKALSPPKISKDVKRLLYVSCGFPALQRDIGMLTAGGWSLSHAEGFVLFPGADHIETFCVLDR